MVGGTGASASLAEQSSGGRDAAGPHRSGIKPETQPFKATLFQLDSGSQHGRTGDAGGHEARLEQGLWNSPDGTDARPAATSVTSGPFSRSVEPVPASHPAPSPPVRAPAPRPMTQPASPPDPDDDLLTLRQSRLRHLEALRLRAADDRLLLSALQHELTTRILHS
ncbi:hypothetical protein HK104_009038, partial [Borealophlyctis nickersoniae]